MSVSEIRQGLASGELTPETALQLVETCLDATPTAELWILHGDLIQLSDSSDYELMDAARSYESARLLEPENPEPLAELGFFYDAVMADPDRARSYLVAALERGAGEECAEALAELDQE